MRLTVTAPGRVCLFGEHQDYLGLPVIAGAIDLELTVALTTEHDLLNRYRLILHDLDHDEIINMAMPIVYQHSKDYLRAVVKTLARDGVPLPQALTAEITSRIPIMAGTSSSTALSMAWTAALLKAAGNPAAEDPSAVMRLSHTAEVVEFNESGGMMDQASIGHGGLIYFRANGEPTVERLPARPRGFVLGDSQEPKDTQAILSRVRAAAEGGMAGIKKVLPGFSLEETPLAEAAEAVGGAGLEPAEKAALLGNLENRDILRAARDLLSSEDVEPAALGRLIRSHHAKLRDNLGISTDKIELMIEKSMAAGALGCKINGSGGGGCMFAYAPGRTAEVAAAIEEAGGKAYPVEITEGIRIRIEDA